MDRYVKQPIWDASAYRDVSTIQLGFGRELIAQHDWRGDERVLDVGCGSGALDAEILDTHPGVHLVGVDVEPGMVAEAQKTLSRFGDRARVLQADVTRLPGIGPFDLVLSNAVLHWVQDHDAAFSSVHRVLAPGGRFLAHCGGQGNLADVHRIAMELMDESPYQEHTNQIQRLWNYQDADSTRARLHNAGLTRIHTDLVPAPARFETDEQWERFLCVVTLRLYLHALPRDLHEPFISSYKKRAEAAGLKRRLDFVRLRIDVRKPSG